MFVYHGSPTANIILIEPRPSRVLNNTKAVFASPFRWVALTSCGHWRDSDLQQGTINGQPYLTEQYPNAFKKVFNKGGYIYSLDDATFRKDPRLTRFELISRQAVKPIKSEYVSDILKELKKEGVTLNYHKDSDKPKSIKDKILSKQVLVPLGIGLGAFGVTRVSQKYIQPMLVQGLSELQGGLIKRAGFLTDATGNSIRGLQSSYKSLKQNPLYQQGFNDGADNNVFLPKNRNTAYRLGYYHATFLTKTKKADYGVKDLKYDPTLALPALGAVGAFWGARKLKLPVTQKYIATAVGGLGGYGAHKMVSKEPTKTKSLLPDDVYNQIRSKDNLTTKATIPGIIRRKQLETELIASGRKAFNDKYFSHDYKTNQDYDQIKYHQL